MKYNIYAKKQVKHRRTKGPDEIKRFYPFALWRIDSLENFLTVMYRSGYKAVRLLFGCIVCFVPCEPREDLQFAVLTTQYRIFRKHGIRQEKWNDAKLLENLIEVFKENNGEQFHMFTAMDTWYYFYLTRFLKGDEYEAFKKQRKKRLIKPYLVGLALKFLMVCLTAIIVILVL